MTEISLPQTYELDLLKTAKGSALWIKSVDSGEIVYHCFIYYLQGTYIVYPVTPVIPLSPDHRQALPDLKLHMLEHLLHNHRLILMSAGNETTGGRFSFQTQLEYAMSRGYNAYELIGSQISRFDDKALQIALAKPWTERLAFVLLSAHELPQDVAYEIPVDYVHSLDKLDARASLED